MGGLIPCTGHNGGPAMDAGLAWRRHCWTRARADLLPTLPVEVLRLRLSRAAELGIDYRTYASLRAAGGHDLVALLFSSNALRLRPPAAAPPAALAARLAGIRACGRGALVHPPLAPASVLALAAGLLDAAGAAPRPFAPWAEARSAVRGLIGGQGWPADRVLLVGDTGEERLWAEAARMAGYLPAQRYFGA
ncbi:MAG: hypothetical protein KJZ85_18780 [Rhodobacteraceae bacterium]|jgi:hypothetical protein|nr:hypothetical protein [Paracoccaceae bacterium]